MPPDDDTKTLARTSVLGEDTGLREYAATLWVVTLGETGSPVVHSPAVGIGRCRREAVNAAREEMEQKLASMRRLGILDDAKGKTPCSR